MAAAHPGRKKEEFKTRSTLENVSHIHILFFYYMNSGSSQYHINFPLTARTRKANGEQKAEKQPQEAADAFTLLLFLLLLLR